MRKIFSIVLFLIVFCPLSIFANNKKWDKLIRAISLIESQHNEKVISKCGRYVGMLQISKITVDECNRILGEKRFTYNHRYDKKRSIEMFYIIQGYYNPDDNIEKAIRIWNGGPDYSIKKTNEYYKLNDKQIEVELKANQTIKQYHPFVFGGQMKISNMSAFKAQVVAWNAKADSNYQKVQLYGNYCMMGPNSTSSLGSIVLGVGQRYNYVRGFYSPPLMNLNNTVLVDITTQDSTYESSACSSGTNLFTTLSNFQYDSLTGVISNGQKSYAFLPNYSWSQTNNDHEANNFYKAYSLDLEDDLAGHFYQVSVTDHYVTSNGKNNGSPNIFYRGLFVWADSVSGTSAQVKLYKFIGGQNNCYSSTYNLAFNSSTKQWTYSSKA